MIGCRLGLSPGKAHRAFLGDVLGFLCVLVASWGGFLPCAPFFERSGVRLTLGKEPKAGAQSWPGLVAVPMALLNAAASVQKVPLGHSNLKVQRWPWFAADSRVYLGPL